MLVFAGISALVARWLTVESKERDDVHRLLKAQARGDANGMLAVLAPACRADRACRAQVEANARALKAPGDVKIIAYDSKTAYSFGSATGRTRVAWTLTGSEQRHVQCVLVHRSGNPVTGTTVTLERVSPPIGNESSC